ncbi:NINE protein, partial [Slackia exigua]
MSDMPRSAEDEIEELKARIAEAQSRIDELSSQATDAPSAPASADEPAQDAAFAPAASTPPAQPFSEGMPQPPQSFAPHGPFAAGSVSAQGPSFQRPSDAYAYRQPEPTYQAAAQQPGPAQPSGAPCGCRQQASRYQASGPASYPPYGYRDPAPAQKDHVVAGLLAIFFGWLGIHKFYLGYPMPGFIMLGITLLGGTVTFGLASIAMGIIGVIEGILYLTRSQLEFE